MTILTTHPVSRDAIFVACQLVMQLLQLFKNLSLWKELCKNLDKVLASGFVSFPSLSAHMPQYWLSSDPFGLVEYCSALVAGINGCICVMTAWR